jgi:plastocyanin
MVLLLVPFPALAQTTHTVTVGDNFFNPSSLTIAVGDTVTWQNASGGMSHNVTANNGSFASTTAAAFTFSHTFNAAGTFNYTCTVHGASMSGTITVQGTQPPPGDEFPINEGLNDSWFNPATDGQGFFITVFPDIQKMFVAWFTYDTQRPSGSATAMLGEPGHRWLTAFGDYSGDTATLDIELTEGGIFDAVQPAPDQSADGTMTIVFAGCNSAQVNFNIPSAGSSGSIPIQRIALDNMPMCLDLAEAQ